MPLFKLLFENGADRIELCDQMEVGGTTPSIEMVKFASKFNIPKIYYDSTKRRKFYLFKCRVSNNEKSILEFKNQNINGFVFGLLTEDFQVDIAKNKELIQLANPLPLHLSSCF